MSIDIVSDRGEWFIGSTGKVGELAMTRFRADISTGRFDDVWLDQINALDVALTADDLLLRTLQTADRLITSFLTIENQAYL